MPDVLEVLDILELFELFEQRILDEAADLQAARWSSCLLPESA
jgi:hypothetical protein